MQQTNPGHVLQIVLQHFTLLDTIFKWLLSLKNGVLFYLFLKLTHWGLAITGSDNGLLPGWHQAIIWTNAGILLIGPLGTNFSEILIEIHI